MMQTKTIDLKTANAILDAVIAASRARDLHPMTMCVLDPGGHVVAAQQEDHSGILRFEIALGNVRFVMVLLCAAALGLRVMLGRLGRHVAALLAMTAGWAEAFCVTPTR